MIKKTNKYDAVLIIPFYNEEKYIKNTLACLDRQKFSNAWCVVFIDNNSKDTTKDIISRFCTEKDIPYTIVFEPKQGTVYSRKRGLNEALKLSKDIIISTDADTMFSPQFIKSTFNDLKDGADVLVGGRTKNARIDLWKRILSKELFNWLRKIRNLEYKIFGPYFFGSHFAIKADFYKKVLMFNPEEHEKFMGEDIFLSRRCHFIGGNFRKSSLSVSAHERRVIKYQDEVFFDFVGNRPSAHQSAYGFGELNYQVLNAKEADSIKKQVLDFTTERFLWSTCDAWLFWMNTNKVHMNSYKAFIKAVDFVDIPQTIFEVDNKRKSQQNLYLAFKKSSFVKAKKQINNYLLETK